jgi:sec-independent protein translocase protein TatC
MRPILMSSEASSELFPGDVNNDSSVPPPQGAMSFLDHLDELRRRLMYSAAAVGLVFVICFTYSNHIYNFLGKPVREVLQKRRQAQLQKNNSPIQVIEQLPDSAKFTYVFNTEANLDGVTIPAGTTMPAKLEGQPGGNRTIVAADRIVVGRNVIPEGFKLSLNAIGTTMSSADDMLVVHTLQGGFNLYVKVAFYAAFAFSVPFLLYQVWLFISPGLYAHEKRGVVPFVTLASLCFIGGVTFAYYVAFPKAASFLLEVSQDFRPLIEVNEYFDLIITILLGLGLVFELPAFVFFFARLGVVTPGLMLRFWRHALVVILIISAILSPTTDIPNMMVFAGPMMILYVISVAIAWLFGRPRQEMAEGLAD